MADSIDVEIILQSFSTNISKKAIIGVVQRYLEKIDIRPNSIISNFRKDEHPILHNDVKSIIVGDFLNSNKTFIDISTLEVKWYVYNLDDYGPMTHSETESSDDGEVVLSTHLPLPSASLMSLWENLYYDNDIKLNLLRYSQTMMEFSDKGVDCNIVSCNRVILLHGPPGTGKTSLCKALAHKLTIRMSEWFTSGLLIEINSHSLFSKWFSESGKLVTKMFTKVKEIVENRNILVCVLIDEVESLAHARNQVSGNEPSDAIRVVNAVLTQIDQIKKYPNVLILATSNLTETIDIAFVDRADIKQYLGMPTVQAIYKIYYSCIVELFKAQIVKYQPLESIENLLNDQEKEHTDEAIQLMKVCEKSLGLSGRSLRKIPFLAHALFLNKNLAALSDFLDAMEKAVEKEFIERQYFKDFKVEK